MKKKTIRTGIIGAYVSAEKEAVGFPSECSEPNI